MIILFPILLNGEDTEGNNFDYGCASFRFVERDNYSFKTSDNIDILIFHRFRHEILHDLLSALVIIWMNTVSRKQNKQVRIYAKHKRSIF